MKPYYQDDFVTLYHGDCREIVPTLGKFDLLLTDPPYPNGAGHFVDDINFVKWFLKGYRIPESLVFWDEMNRPPSPLPLCAVHIWHRTNTNRPDNYEAIYHFCENGKKRASRVLDYSVIYPGLTGCVEATGHPTQKNVALIRALIGLSLPGSWNILDPFAGSGTTGRAAKDLGRKCTLIEKEEKYCEIAAKRMGQEILTFE
jgi:site-specific DNA-methyltransferase (adenine-specific)